MTPPTVHTQPGTSSDDTDYDEPDDYEYYDDYEDSHAETDLDSLDAAHETYLKKSGLQLERPEWERPDQPPPKPPPSWMSWLSDFLGRLAPLFQFLFYAIIAAVIGGFLYFLFGEAIRVRFGKPKLGDDKIGDDVLADIRPDAAMARSLLEEADTLARAGKFAEAVHLLLFRSIEDIQTRLEGGVPKSLTAREIGSLGRLPDRARKGLHPIIEIVERSFFGGRAVDAESWQQARTSYEDFAFGEGWA
ncbi:MAG: hypothetical protein R3C13_12140 [Hyphomonas sp.]|uniref:DUF4129 domain-containing protein n=1 Tax=Hyphomonas sp. TaxID=87 RepID=UPI0035294B76